MLPRESSVVTYYDRLERQRRREKWATYAEAWARYVALSQTAFAEDVRIED